MKDRKLNYRPSFFHFVSPLDDTTFTLRQLMDRNSTECNNCSESTHCRFNPIEMNDTVTSSRTRFPSITAHIHPYNTRTENVALDKIFTLNTLLLNEASTLTSAAFATNQRCIHYTRSENFDIPLIQGIHLEQQELQRYRLVADAEMDNILLLYDETLSNHVNSRQKTFQSFDIITALGHDRVQYESSNIAVVDAYGVALQSFYEHYYELKPFIKGRDDEPGPKEDDFLHSMDWATIQRGMDVFIRYAPVVAMSLYYLGLIPGFSIPLLNKVLQETKYLAPPSPLERVKARLMDTGAFLAFLLIQDPTDGCSKQTNGERGREEIQSPDANYTLPASTLRPGGRGWKMALRVRCLHAKVRRSLLLQSPNKWNTETNGIPINQEDMAATLLAFSLNVIYGIEFVAGTSISNREKLDYMALWRYVGWILGVDTSMLDPCRTFHPRTHFQTDHSILNELKFLDLDPLFYPRVMMESILCHIMNPDESSVAMAHHLLQIRTSAQKSILHYSPKPLKRPSFQFLYRGYLCRRFIGDNLSDQLCLPNPRKDLSLVSLLSYLCTWIVLIVLRCYIRLIINYPRIRNKAYQWHYRALGQFLSSWERAKSRRNEHSANDAASCPYYSVQ